MTKVVLLAAGKSSRTSGMKQLYKIGHEYLINVQIHKLLSYGYSVVVILGHRYEEILDVIEDRVEIIHNKNYEEGMFSSVCASFENIQCEKFLFCHIDRPILSKEVYTKVLQSDKDIAVAYCCGKKAPPIMIRQKLKSAILNSDEERLDFWIASQKSVAYVDVDTNQIHFNANSDVELERYFRDEN